MHPALRKIRCDPSLNKRRAAKPAVYFGLQRRPGLAGRQPRIEDYNLRHNVARQIVDAVMSHRARQICAGRDIWFRCASKQLFGWPNHFVHISRSRNATRGACFVKNARSPARLPSACTGCVPLCERVPCPRLHISLRTRDEFRYDEPLLHRQRHSRDTQRAGGKMSEAVTVLPAPRAG